jgi:hypothetical protein
MRRIPKIVHYVFGMAPDFGGKPWGLVHYACVRSAIRWIKPQAIYLYYQFEPSGVWWELTRPLLTPARIEGPEEIFGNPLRHFAHRADIVRLSKLIEYGGIYLDADVLVQRSFDDLLDERMVLGQEGEGGSIGLGNAVILAEPNARFLRRWQESYRTFRSKGRDPFWNEHSVQASRALASQYPDEIRVLSHQSFFWPLWFEEHLRWIYDSTDPIAIDETYANHLWETLSWEFLKDLTPGIVRGRDTNFHRWVEPYLADLPDDFGTP